MSTYLDRHQLWILGSLGAVTVAYGYYKYTFSFWSKQGVKGPTPWPLIGTISFKISLDLQVNKYEKYGSVWGEYLGPKPILVVGDPELLKSILIKDFNSFVNHTLTFKLGYDLDMLTEMKDDEWRRVRQIVTPAFTTMKMKRIFKMLVSCGDDLMSALDDLKVSDGVLEDVDLMKQFRPYSINTTARGVFAVDVNAHKDSNNPFARHAMSFLAGQSKVLAALRTIFVLMAPRLAQAFKVSIIPGHVLKYYAGIVTEVLVQRKRAMVEGKVPHNDFIQILLEAEQEAARSGEEIKGRKSLTDKEIIGQCVIFLLAGYENNAILLSMVCFYLSRDPEVQQRLYEEVTSTEFDYDTILHKMPLLEAVVTESSRFFSIALDRIANQDYILPKLNVTIPKGTQVVVPTYAMHRSESIWGPDAKEFNPDRFMKGPIDTCAYLTFGAGPRNCIGLRFAQMVVKMATVRILQRYEIKPSANYDKPHPDLNGIFKDGYPRGLTVNFHPRDAAA